MSKKVCCGADKKENRWSKREKIRIRGIIRIRGASILAGSESVGASSMYRFLLIEVCRIVQNMTTVPG
jgi:hypothetical protein